jgi:hypothetical protein
MSQDQGLIMLNIPGIRRKALRIITFKFCRFGNRYSRNEEGKLIVPGPGAYLENSVGLGETKNTAMARHVKGSVSIGKSYRSFY